MGIYSVLIDTDFVRAVSEGVKDAAERRERRDSGKKRERRDGPRDGQPVTNPQGEITGKVLDTTA